jgi:hypothetical protein
MHDSQSRGTKKIWSESHGTQNQLWPCWRGPVAITRHGPIHEIRVWSLILLRAPCLDTNCLNSVKLGMKSVPLLTNRDTPQLSAITMQIPSGAIKLKAFIFTSKYTWHLELSNLTCLTTGTVPSVTEGTQACLLCNNIFSLHSCLSKER